MAALDRWFWGPSYTCPRGRPNDIRCCKPGRFWAIVANPHRNPRAPDMPGEGTARPESPGTTLAGPAGWNHPVLDDRAP